MGVAERGVSPSPPSRERGYTMGHRDAWHQPAPLDYILARVGSWVVGTPQKRREKDKTVTVTRISNERKQRKKMWGGGNGEWKHP